MPVHRVQRTKSIVYRKSALDPSRGKTSRYNPMAANRESVNDARGKGGRRGWNKGVNLDPENPGERRLAGKRIPRGEDVVPDPRCGNAGHIWEIVNS